MSFGSKPAATTSTTNSTQVTSPSSSTVDPYANMPAWLKSYIQGSVGNLAASDDRIDQLRKLYSDPDMLIQPYNGQEGEAYTIGAAEAGMGIAGDSISSARDAAARGVGVMEGAEGRGRSALDDVISQLRTSGSRLSSIDTDLGAAPDTSGSQSAMRQFGQIGLNSANRSLGGAFDTASARDTLTGMDIEGRQRRYETDYTDQIVTPIMSRMREDEARRLAQLEGSAAAIGGSSNTRMGVEAARLSDEAMRSRAQTEAEMRQKALREAQELGLQESQLVGDLTQTAAQLGLSQSELEAAIRRQEGEMGLAGAQFAANVEQAAAQLGMSEAELQATISQRAAELGITIEEAQRMLLGDITRNVSGQYDMASGLSGAYTNQAGTDLSAGQLGLDTARMGMAAGGFMTEQAERERQLTQEATQAPLTMEAWARNLSSTGPALAPPVGGVTQNSGGTVTTTGTQTGTQSGGGAGIGTQLLGAGTSILGAFLSDERIKDDVEHLDGALDIIRKQRPSVYRYIDPAYDRVQIEGRRSAGLMAQDLEDIPGAVIETETGVKMVDPYPVMATIAAAVQELDRKVEAMSHG